MKIAIVLTIAVAAVGIARAARIAAKEDRSTAIVDRPSAPNPTAAPILTLGYRELAADLMFVRMVGYFPSPHSEPEATAALAEAMIGLDPMFRRAYEFGAIAMTDARKKPDQALQLRAIALLEQGARRFPTSYRFPMLAGQIYLGDLQTTDPALRRTWDEKGALLFETAARKPGAPANIAMQAATMRSKLGQHQRAVDNLREMLLITSDRRSRASILEQLAKLAAKDSRELAAEIHHQRRRFEAAWKRDRPALPPTSYLLIGPRIAPGFDLTDLATGGHDLVSTDAFERLEPLTDETPPAQPGTP